jgi:hypothetical protein
VVGRNVGGGVGSAVDGLFVGCSVVGWPDGLDE